MIRLISGIGRGVVNSVQSSSAVLVVHSLTKTDLQLRTVTAREAFHRQNSQSSAMRSPKRDSSPTYASTESDWSRFALALAGSTA